MDDIWTEEETRIVNYILQNIYYIMKKFIYK